MLVMKFGGTSVGDGAKIAAVAQIVAASTRPVLVVSSAMTKVTDALLQLARVAVSGDMTQAEGILALLEERHSRALDEAKLPQKQTLDLIQEIQDKLAELRRWAQGVSLLQELTPRSLDAFASMGELLAAPIVAAALRAIDKPAVYIDPRLLMHTDDSFGSAIPDEVKLALACQQRVLPLLREGTIVVTGGFVGATLKSQTTTLGRGGSDYSAALFGAAIHAEAIEIWTDVDGILTADPRVVPNAKLLDEITYAEAAEMAFFGAKVLHPATIRPAVQRGIPVWIKNTFRPEVAGTVVRAEVKGEGLRAFACRKGCAALLVSNPRMLLAHGYAAKVFGVFERCKVPVDVITTSEVSIAVTVEQSAPLQQLVEEIQSFAEVQVVRGLGVLTAVGSRLRSTPNIASRIFAALGEINVYMISQGASDTNITIVIEEAQLNTAMQRLHDAFFSRT